MGRVRGRDDSTQAVSEQFLREARAKARIGRDRLRKASKTLHGDTRVPIWARQRGGGVNDRSIITHGAIATGGIELLERQTVWVEQGVARSTGGVCAVLLEGQTNVEHRGRAGIG